MTCTFDPIRLRFPHELPRTRHAADARRGPDPPPRRGGYPPRRARSRDLRSCPGLRHDGRDRRRSGPPSRRGRAARLIPGRTGVREDPRSRRQVRHETVVRRRGRGHLIEGRRDHEPGCGPRGMNGESLRTCTGSSTPPRPPRGEIVLGLIREHPEGRLVLPGRDGVRAMLDGIALSRPAPGPGADRDPEPDPRRR